MTYPKFLRSKNIFSMTIQAPRLLKDVEVTFVNAEGETYVQNMPLHEALDRIAYAAIHSQAITVRQLPKT